MKRPRRLSKTFCEGVTTPGRYSDGPQAYGLSLLVKPSARGGVSKSWAQFALVRGRYTSIGLGRLSDTSLKDVRENAKANYEKLTKGIDPRESRDLPTFSQAAETVICEHESKWREDSGEANSWRSSIRIHVLPKLGKVKVSDIAPEDIENVLRPLWTTKQTTAKRLKTRIHTIMKACKARGFITENPAEDIEALLPKVRTHKVTHHRTVAHNEVAEEIATVRKSNGSRQTILLFELICLTLARTKEARLARWHEIDFDNKVWTLTDDRMKADREHRVPLSDAAIQVLTQARKLADGSGDGFIFPSPEANGKPLSDNTLRRHLRKCDVKTTAHGLRSSFKGWALETGGYDRPLVEASLAHTIGENRTEQSYIQTDLLEQRRDVMQSWGDYLSTQ